MAAILDGRKVSTRSPNLMPAQAAARPGQPVPIRLQKAPRPLYAADLLSPPRISVHDTTLQAPDPGEAAPVALNSFEAVKAGLPAGPYRAGLIEEIEADPDRPRIEGGTVLWTSVPGDDPSPEAPPAALVAEVSLDGPGSRARVTLRPLREPGTPPTVAMEVVFTGPLAAVTRVGLPELRNAGVDRGIPLFGVVTAQDGVFRVTLAREQTDGEQNVRLLMTRPWIDLPMRLQDGRRVIVAFEKGTAVREMMRNALRLWRMPWLP